MRRRGFAGSPDRRKPPALAVRGVRELQARPVLIVEDDRTSVRLIEAGLDVLRLANPRQVVCRGDEAIDVLAAASSGEREVPALVLLDIGLPGMSGIEVLQWTRAHPSLAGVPVLLLTADGTPESIRQAYAAGASSYLVKPVGFDALADVLRGLELPWTIA